MQVVVLLHAEVQFLVDSLILSGSRVKSAFIC
nr:MAG TPA: hypothetical protein [Siphoviridae sp. ctBfm1]DAR77129.1 MAG TPA: hypothetical protein [Caudoviricetes sp.]